MRVGKFDSNATHPYDHPDFISMRISGHTIRNRQRMVQIRYEETYCVELNFKRMYNRMYKRIQFL